MSKPPKYALWFFRWFCRSDYAEDIEGDLYEVFERLSSTYNQPIARAYFLIEVAKLIRPNTFKKLKTGMNQSLYVHFIKLSLRNLKRPGFFQIVNLLGLSLALASVITIHQFVATEYNTDSFFSNKDQIYRLIRKVEDTNASYRSPLLAATYKDQFLNTPGLNEKSVIRVFYDDELVTYDEKSFFENEFAYVDKDFFTLFDFPFRYGDPVTALDQQNAVVISEAMATKYFGDIDPIGKILEIDNKGLLKVTGVLSEPPSKTHIKASFIAPMSAMGYVSRLLEERESHAFNYYLLSSGALPAIPTGIEPNTKITWQPLKEVYFDDSISIDNSSHGNKNLLRSLVILAVLIIIIAGANYLNILLSNSLQNIKALGIRKVLGASWKMELGRQLIETNMTILLCMALAWALYSALPYLIPDLPASTLPFEMLISLPIASVLLSLAFTIYPVIIASATTASEAIAKKVKSIKIRPLQEGILSFQFAVAMVLIVMSIVITQQFDYLQKRELGLSPDQILYFSSNNKHSYKNIEKIKNEVDALSGVKEVAMCIGGLPNSFTEAISFNVEGMESQLQMMTAFAEAGFPKTIGLELIEGQLFNEKLKSKIGQSAILNEAAAKQLGWPETEVLGRAIEPKEYFAYEEGQSWRVIGIVKDYHFESLKERIAPLVILNSDLEETFVIKLASAESSETVEKISEIWSDYVPKYPFQYSFLDAHFQAMIEKDTRQRRLLYLFSAFTILISIGGLLGLSAYVLNSRRKEIALRNVLGAPMNHFLLLFSKRYFKLLAVATGISVFTSIYFSRQWLNDFSYRISLSPDMFITGVGMVTALVFIILIAQIVHSISANPIEELNND